MNQLSHPAAALPATPLATGLTGAQITLVTVAAAILTLATPGHLAAALQRCSDPPHGHRSPAGPEPEASRAAQAICSLTPTDAVGGRCGRQRGWSVVMAAAPGMPPFLIRRRAVLAAPVR